MQLTELRGYIARQGWEPVEYVETMSSVRRRPIFDQLMKDARMKRFDVVLVWKIDRFARSTKQFIDVVMELDAAGVRFMAPNQGIDTDQRSPAAKLFTTILSAFAEFERNIIVERVTAGLNEYRDAFSKGRIGTDRHSRSGRDLPHGRPARMCRRDRAVELYQANMSFRKIALELKVPLGTVQRALKGVSKTP
jgi:putative DNA-invertase from lambdoid prophage Rac